MGAGGASFVTLVAVIHFNYFFIPPAFHIAVADEQVADWLDAADLLEAGRHACAEAMTAASARRTAHSCAKASAGMDPVIGQAHLEGCGCCLYFPTGGGGWLERKEDSFSSFTSSSPLLSVSRTSNSLLI